MKLEKDGVIKEVLSEREVNDYMLAGWKKFVERPKFTKVEPKTYENRSKNNG